MINQRQNKLTENSQPYSGEACSNLKRDTISEIILPYLLVPHTRDDKVPETRPWTAAHRDFPVAKTSRQDLILINGYCGLFSEVSSEVKNEWSYTIRSHIFKARCLTKRKILLSNYSSLEYFSNSLFTNYPNIRYYTTWVTGGVLN